jgi:hypothetical protein
VRARDLRGVFLPFTRERIFVSSDATTGRAVGTVGLHPSGAAVKRGGFHRAGARHSEARAASGSPTSQNTRRPGRCLDVGSHGAIALEPHRRRRRRRRSQSSSRSLIG